MKGTAAGMALEVLRRHVPFSTMSEAVLDDLAHDLRETFYAEGETVLAPADGLAARLLIVKQGRLRGAVQAPDGRLGHDVRELGAGESFPISALLTERAVQLHYRAVHDTFCYEVPRAVFQRLIHSSPEFLLFCSQRLPALLKVVNEASRKEIAKDRVDQLPLTRPLREVVRRDPVVCLPETPLHTAFETLTRERVGSIVVVDGDQRPLGIFTLHDVLPRVVLPGLALETPIGAVMTAPPLAMPPGVPTWQAALAMARNGIGHLCLVENERLMGVVSERDLFPMQRERLVPLTRTIVEAHDLPALQQAVRGIPGMVEQMLAQGLGAEPLVEIITALNDHTTFRAIELCLEAHGAEHGPRSAEFTWIAFGSEGRQEQTLKTDQDNGMLVRPAPGQSADAARAELLPLARRINEALAACGFPLCLGNVMASNPKCCLTQQEWRERFAFWVDQGAPEYLLDACIYFDFRPLYGDPAPAEELRAWLGEQVPHNERFLHQMAANALRNRPPLSLWDSIQVSRGGEHPHTINLKLQGLTPFVDAGRLYALAGGIGETNTARRLLAAAEQGRMPEAEARGAVTAWAYLLTLRMRQHQRLAEAGAERNDFIDPDGLNDLEHRLLKEVLRQARRLQTRMALDFGA